MKSFAPKPKPYLECGDMSPLSDWQTCLPAQSAVMPAQSKLENHPSQLNLIFIDR
jgi:hypothetical protein